MIPNDYQCDGQMTIYEFLPQSADFCTMKADEVIDIIGQRIGVRFVWDEELGEYFSQLGKLRLHASIDKYTVTHHGSETLIAGHKHISCGWQMPTEGGGKPCNSIDEAVSYLQKAIERVKHGKVNNKQ